jgi:hypothetical protein
VNEAICDARPAEPGGLAPDSEGQKRGGSARSSLRRSRPEAAAEVTRLAAVAAASLAGGTGLEAAEKVIRAGLIRMGAGVLEDLLAADAGYAGPRAGCGAGHQARFAGYRDKTVDTVLGPVRLRRGWYHCDRCVHGLAPRDVGLGVAGQGMSPGLRKMTARAAAAVSFAAAGRRAGRGHLDRPAGRAPGRSPGRPRCGR